MRASQPRRNVRSSRGTRENILRAARRLLLDKGYDATTMQDIVKAAGTSIGNAYFYFENKDDLTASLIEELAASAWSSTDELMATIPPGPARLAIMVRSNAAMLSGAHADLMRLSVLGATSDRLRERISRRFAARIRDTIEVNLPGYPVERLDLAVAAWLGAARTCYEQYAAGTLAASPIEIADFVITWNLRGLGLEEAEIEAAIAVARRVLPARQAKTGARKKKHTSSTGRRRRR